MYLKLTISATSFFYSDPYDNTTRCLVELYNDNDESIRGYVTGVRKESLEIMTDNLRTQVERVRLFKEFLQKNIHYFGFNYETLYKPGVTSQEFDDFVDHFESQWGEHQSRGYNQITNNCAVSAESVIDYFFPRQTRAELAYTALLAAPYIAGLYCNMDLMIPFSLGISSIFLKPGFTLPHLLNFPSNPLIKAKLITFFSNKRADEQPVIENSETQHRIDQRRN